ncbi:hypothetical protein SVAN01_10980 [Stagonosporopsis vannaccii]|nr:hypothetical protein SVAN01_10980 [Stagonosporopsis vannaccii]
MPPSHRGAPPSLYPSILKIAQISYGNARSAIVGGVKPWRSFGLTAIAPEAEAFQAQAIPKIEYRMMFG